MQWLQAFLGFSDWPSSKNKRKRADEDAQELKVIKATKSALQLRECIVCFDDVELEKFPTVEHHETQAHRSDVCMDCRLQHCRAQIEAGNDAEGALSRSHDIQCAQCHEILTQPEVQRLADHDTYES